MQIVYALTSNGEDLYHAMTRISAASVRITMPSVDISIFVDSESMKYMRTNSADILQDGYKFIEVVTPPGLAIFRNRWIKTSIHRYLTTPFVYLDADTLVRKRLDELFKCDQDCAAAPNHSIDEIQLQLWDEDRKNLEQMNWTTDFPTYFNGGVLYFSQSNDSRQLCDRWHQRYNEGFERTGRSRDQPALNQAISELGTSIKTLSHDFNAQFQMSPKVAPQARIWHYYPGAHFSPLTEFECYARKCVRTQCFSVRRIAWMARQSHPWRARSFLDMFVAKSIIRKNVMLPKHCQWYQLSHFSYLSSRIRRWFSA